MRKLEITDPRVQEAIVLYKSGKSMSAISAELHMDRGVLQKMFKRMNILRSKAEAIRNSKSAAPVNDDALEVLTPDALYWIGFLYADGHIEKEPRQRISLTLAEKDIHHLEKFNDFFGGGKLTITNVTQKNSSAPGQVNFGGQYFRVSFSSKKIYQKLKSLGFTSNKSYYLIPCDNLKYSRDFWRGVIDGDGWLCQTGDKYNYADIGLSGTESTLLGFLEFIKGAGVITKTSPSKDKRSNVWKMDIHGKSSKKIALILYKDATIYLDRKYEVYQDWLNSPEEDEVNIINN